MFITVVVVCLHFMAATSAGALWRDEANTVAIATLPSFGDVWNNLPSESFPILWVAIIRAFAALAGAMNDPAFRVLGFIVGIGVVAALWMNASTFRHSLPLVSLALLGASPTMIRWGDTVRAYGFGILLILLTCALLWRFLQRPSAGRLTATTLAAIASVHTLYYNSVLLLAFCSGAVAVCARRRAWKQGAMVISIGALAAASLMIYVPTIRRVGEWSAIVRMPDYTLSWFWAKLDEALRPAGSWTLVVWSAFVALSVVVGVLAIVFPKRLKLSEFQRQVILFSLVTLLVGVICSFIFLNTLSYYTNPWYYLSLLALTAVCVDALTGALITTRGARIARIALTLVIVVAAFIPTRRAVRTRLTDVDIVAARLESFATPRDLVLVSPWHYGISFSRYYDGPAPWRTIPPLESSRIVHYDQVVDKMVMPDQTAPVRPVVEQVMRTLQSGNRVFVVGVLLRPAAGERAAILPPARRESNSLPEGAYTNQWLMMVGDVIQRHAARIEPVTVEADRVVSHYENVSIQAASGWRP